ncbi:MAG TPA: aromatic ring-hydroxylating dioxygenase subunit alpha [Baekduia sp.]|nr:aromatic ring-hydroxylating dioxygenase subunit alpha [Baekduia sp.]
MGRRSNRAWRSVLLTSLPYSTATPGSASMTQQADLRPAASEHTGPPKEWFLDEAWFRRDLEAVFKPRWLLAGHVTELSTPGAYLTYALGEDEVVIQKDESGTIHAFHNVCAHRGAKLCPERSGRGSKRRIICPYHGWSYSASDGSLMAAPGMHDGFDKAPWGLTPAHVDVWNGLIMVSFAAERPLPMNEHMGGFSMGKYDTSRIKVAATKSHLVNANWKVVVENNLECYHCAINHPELLSSFDWKASKDDDFDGTVAAREAGLEVWHLELDVPFTLNNARVCKANMPRLDENLDAATIACFWEPGFAFTLAKDYGWIFSPRALSPSLTEIRQYWLVAEDAVEGVDYTREEVMEFWDVTLQQDRELCENVAAGMGMEAYSPGPLNRLYQSGQAAFFAWYTRQMREHYPDEVRESGVV